MIDALLAGIAAAIERVDLREHVGVHPRVGAADVVPLVPLSADEMPLAVAGGARARCPGRAGARAARLPVRRGGWRQATGVLPARGARRAARARVEEGELVPDEGPREIDPRSGCGPRRRSPRARRVQPRARDRRRRRSRRDGRRRSGSRAAACPASRRSACELPASGRVQVSMNVVDVDAAPLHEVVERVRAEARELGVEVAGGELVGLVPERVVAAAAAAGVELPGDRRVADPRARAAALDSRREPADRPDRGGSHPRPTSGRPRWRDSPPGSADSARERMAAARRARRRRSRGAHVRRQHRLRQVRVRTHPRRARGGAAAAAPAQPRVRRRRAVSRRGRPRGDAPAREHAREGRSRERASRRSSS